MNAFAIKRNTNISPLLKKNRGFTITNRQIITVSVIMCFFTCALFLIVSAKGGDYTVTALGRSYHYKNAAAKLAMKMADDVYGTSYLSSIANMLSISGNVSYSALLNMCTLLYDKIVPVGYVLLVLYFCLELIEKTQMDNFTPEHFIKMFIKIIVGTILINDGLTLLTKSVQFADSMAYIVSQGVGDPPVSAKLAEYMQELEKASFITAIPAIIELLIPSVAMLLCRLVIYVTLYSRIIELFARGVFAPIGMANIYSGGINSSGYRYFKKIVAIGLQGAIIIAIVRCMNTIMASIINSPNMNAFFGPITQLVVALATAMLIIKSQNWANDIVGA